MAWFGKSLEQQAPPQQAPVLSCSFCHKTQLEVKKLIAGPDVHICDACVRLCWDIIEDQVPEVPEVTIPTPAPSLAELRAALDLHCVGQENAKRALVAAMAMQLARLQPDTPNVKPPVLLLVGPHGCGKTTLARALCKATTLPATLADINRLSATGYVGLDVENLLYDLVRQSGEDHRLAESGILALDGLHRVATKAPPIGTARDITGESVQRELLRVLEGQMTEVHGQHPRHPQQAADPFWCGKLLVVLTATFVGVPSGERTARERLAGQGMLHELLARVDRIVVLPALTHEELAQTFTRNEHGLLPRQIAALACMGIEVEVEPGATRAMIDPAAASPDGAWALQRPLARLAQEAMEHADDDQPWVVTEQMVRRWEPADG